MSSFTGDLTLTQLPLKWKLWRIESDFRYEVGEKGSGKTITVPKQFITDGASVPRLLWSLLPSWGSYSRAAVIHDYLCYRITNDTPHEHAPSRLDADNIFYEAMGVCGTHAILKWILYAGVRTGSAIYALRKYFGYPKLSDNPPGL